MIDWNDYQYFLAVAETGSLSAAARRLKVAQPTVGRRVQALENALQVRLFEHLNHGYALTTAGASILESVQFMEQQALTIARRVEGSDTQAEGKVCVTASEGLAAHWLVQQLGELKKRFPKLELELLVGISKADLLRREADIALRVGEPGSEELVGRRIGKIRCGLYAADSYLQQYGEPKDLTQLAGHRFIESVCEIADLAQAKLLRRVAAGAEVVLYCNSLLTQLQALRAGLGLLAIPNYMARDLSEVRRILTADFDLALDIWMLTHQELRSSARIRAVFDFLVAAVRQDQLVL